MALSKQNILEIEDRVQSVLDRLRIHPWLEFRLTLLYHLVITLLPEISPSAREAYLLEFRGEIEDIFPPATPIPNLHPRILSDLSRELFSKTNGESGSAERMAVLLAGLYFRLRDLESLTQYLTDRKLLERSDKEKPISDRNLWHQRFASRLPQGYQDIFSAVQSESAPRSDPHQALGLFVVPDSDVICGQLGMLTLSRLSLDSRLGVDQIRIATHLVDESDVLANQTKTLCAYLRETGLLPRNQFIRLEYALDQPSSLLVGNSIGLALTLLAQLGLSNYGRNSAQIPHIYSDVGFTGAVEVSGKLLPVDEMKLSAKVEAAFFGPVRTIIVPPNQTRIAGETVAELKKEFPNRDLQIQSAPTLTKLTERRDVIFLQQRTPLERVNQWIREHANSVTLTILGFIVLAGLGFWFGVVKNPVPDHTSVDNDRIAVKNRYGFTIWKSEPFGQSLNSEICAYISKVHDLDNDGKLEILIAYGNAGRSINKGQLVCYYENGEVFWQIDTGKEVQYGDNIYSDYFSIEQLFIDDLNNDKLEEICFISSQGYFPNRIAVINSSGQLISEYWNVGGIANIAAVDLIPDNNTKELIFTGRNNEYKTGIVLVIDPFNISGQSPQTSHYYTQANTAEGNEIYYIRFPLTHFRFTGYRDMTKGLTYNNNLEIKVYLTSERLNSGSVHYIFNKSFVVKFADLDDSYYRAYKIVFPEKEMLKYNDPELIQYFREVEFWDGDNWVKKPTMNRLYSKQINK